MHPSQEPVPPLLLSRHQIATTGRTEGLEPERAGALPLPVRRLAQRDRERDPRPVFVLLVPHAPELADDQTRGPDLAAPVRVQPRGRPPADGVLAPRGERMGGVAAEKLVAGGRRRKG